jgi:hypothetical protein
VVEQGLMRAGRNNGYGRVKSAVSRRGRDQVGVLRCCVTSRSPADGPEGPDLPAWHAACE